jgi:ribosomal protein S11
MPPRIARWTFSLLVLALIALLPGTARAQTTYSGGGASITTSDSPTTVASSSITVSGAPGTVATVKVQLLGVKSDGESFASGPVYNSMAYAEFLLEGPGGAELVLLGQTGDTIDGCDENVNNATCDGLQGATTGSHPDTITIQDGAHYAPNGAGSLGDQYGGWQTADMPYTVEPSSNYNTNGDGPPPLPVTEDTADYPQPDGSATLTSRFAGTTANGTWTLYLIDNDDPVDPFSITGWNLILTFAAATPTTTVLSSSAANPAFYANSSSSTSITFTATVTSGSGTPTGSVTFQANGSTISGCGGVALSSGVAHCTVSLSQGANAITAAYTPTGSFGQSDASMTQMVEVTAANASGNQWCNNSSISDPISDAVGLVYPSVIVIPSTAYPGKTVADVSVELEGVAGPVNGIAGQFLLVAPGGGTHNLDFLEDGFSQPGSATGSVNLTFEDSAGAYVPTTSPPLSGTYLPTDNNEDVNPDSFPASNAPTVDSSIPQVPGTINFAAPYGSDTTRYTHTNILTFGEAFNGASADGDWALYSLAPESLTVNFGWCITLSLNTGTATTTAVTSSQNPQTTGQSVTITATVTAGGDPVTSGGTVTFTDTTGSTPVTLAPNVALNGSGVASFNTSSLTEGDHEITANYSGTSSDNASFGSMWQRINTATTVTNVNSNTWKYCNPGAVQSFSGYPAGPFTPNPSNIFVTNLPGTLNTVSVQLTGFSVPVTENLDELASLVEGPTGAALDFFSNTTQGSSGNSTASSGNYIFADSAGSFVSSGNTNLSPGSYEPTAYESYLAIPDSFTSSVSGQYPAPLSFSYAPNTSFGSFSTFGNVFTNGSNANGRWSLFFNTTDGAQGTIGAANGWCVNLTENLPSLAQPTLAHAGSFSPGEQNAAYTVNITNNGPGSTGDPTGSSPLKVTDILNSAFTYSTFAGTGWSCSAVGQTVTCTNDSPVAEAGSYPMLTIDVDVANNASGSINNIVSVSGAGVTAINSNTDSVTITAEPPTVSGISPSSGPTAGGTSVTITGTNFTGATGVTIGGAAATNVVVVSGTSITATTPAGTAGTASVVVTTPGGSNAANTLFTYIAPPTVTAGATVTFVVGGSPVALDSGLTVSTSSSTVTGATVSIASGAGADTLNFTNQNGITGSFSAGTLTLTGTATVAIYQVALESVTFSTTSTSVTPRTINWTVTNSVASSAPATSTVDVLLPPTVSGISPSSGPTAGGTPVSITGTNFTGATGVTIGGAAATNVVVVSGTSITATTPAGTAGTASVVVTTTYGSNVANTLFTYVAPAATTLSATGGTPQSATVNTAFGSSLQATVKDQFGNPYPGASVTFTAPGAGASGTFSNSSNSVTVTTNASGVASAGTFTANTTPGTYGVTASVSGLGSTAAFSLTNNSGAATHLVIPGGPEPFYTAFGFSIYAYDAGGNLATSYNGTVAFTSSDPGFANLGPVTLVNGVGTQTGVLRTAGIDTITATDVSNSSITGTGSFTIPPGPAVYLVVSAPSSAIAGSPISFTVTAYDLFLNVATGYGGTVAFTSSDPNAMLPGSTAITNGTGTFSATMETAGTQTITATDSVNSLAASSGNISVTIPALVVTTPNDDAGAAGNCTVQTTPGTGTDASCSLRDALLQSAALGSASITFDATAFASAQSITLSSDTLNIPSNTTITGPTSGSGATLRNLVTVNGSAASPVFTVNSGVTNASLSGLIVTNGSSGSGGGISNSGTLTVTNSTISGNSASAAYGGGIFNAGTLTVSDSTISGNSAANGQGGGIFNAGTLTVSDSTISGNSAAGGLGGGILNISGTVTVSDTTISANSADDGGGIVLQPATTVNLANAIVSGNSAAVSSPDLFNIGGTLNDNGGNQLNLSPTAINLGLLANNGGPTQTMLPLPGSPAICFGTSANAAAVSGDQRGLGFDPNCTVGSNTVDSGSVQTNYGLSFTTEPPALPYWVFTGVPISPAPVVGLTENGVVLTAATSLISMSDNDSQLGGTTAVALASGSAAFPNLIIASPVSGDTLTATLALNPTLAPPLNLTASSSPFTDLTGQTISFTPITGTQYVGTQQSLSATASSSLPVTFSSTTSSVCSVSGSTLSMLTQGTCIVFASQAGNSSYAPIAAAQSFAVRFTTQTISFTPITGTQYALTQLTLSAAASSSLPITFSSSTTSVCLVSGSTLSLLIPGTCIVHASQAGNADYAAAPPAAQSFAVTIAPQTISFTPIAGPQYVSTQLTLSATASSSLPVSFASTTPSVCSVAGSTLSLLIQGTCIVHATQAGNNVYAAAPPAGQSFSVNGASQTITFTPITGTQYALTQLTLSATASSSLPVTFSSTTTSVCTVAGNTLSLLTAGACVIQASQAGNTVYATATAAQSIGVHLVSQTISSFPPVTGAQYAATQLTLSATASSSLPVAFSSTTTSVCSVSGSTLSLLTAGTCIVHASQAGNPAYSAATTAQSFAVRLASQTITFTPVTGTQHAGTQLTLSATASSTLPVTFSSTTTSVCSVSGSTLSLLTAGDCIIHASQAGSTVYAPAATAQSFGVRAN